MDIAWRCPVIVLPRIQEADLESESDEPDPPAIEIPGGGLPRKTNDFVVEPDFQPFRSEQLRSNVPSLQLSNMDAAHGRSLPVVGAKEIDFLKSNDIL